MPLMRMNRGSRRGRRRSRSHGTPAIIATTTTLLVVELHLAGSSTPRETVTRGGRHYRYERTTARVGVWEKKKIVILSSSSAGEEKHIALLVCAVFFLRHCFSSRLLVHWIFCHTLDAFFRPPSHRVVYVAIGRRDSSNTAKWH
jgi:hypothetical protein